jgi:hypothetical protein
LEVEVPEGIRLTRAKLLGYSPETIISGSKDKSVKDEHADTNGGSATSEHSDTVWHGDQCAHLHLSDIPRSFAGVGIISLRLRDELVLRGALINAGFTLLMLSVVAIFLKSYEQQTDATVAILLGIPGGVSLYLARPREPGMSAAMHSGVRLLALGNAIAAFLAVSVVVAGGRCVTSAKTGQQSCTAWDGTQPTTLVIAGAAMIIFVLLVIAFINARHPPEHRDSRYTRLVVDEPDGALG